MKPSTWKALGASAVISMVLLTSTSFAGRPAVKTMKECTVYKNSKCDTTASTYTCTDVACHEATVDGHEGGSEKFIFDKNINMKICKNLTGNFCTSWRRHCGDFYGYIVGDCIGPYLSLPGYQNDCQ